jgi:hypothetical protein
MSMTSLRRQVFAMVLSISVTGFAQTQVGTITSSRPFQLRGANVNPGPGVPTWPVMPSDVIATVARTAITVDLEVPAGTRALQIQLARKPSLKFDNAIAGVLRIHEVATVRRQTTVDTRRSLRPAAPTV